MPMKLWTPSAAAVERANLTHYRRWLKENYGRDFADYSALWQWSVSQRDDFWSTLLTYFDVAADGSPTPVTNEKPMPYTRWFEHLGLNYAENLFMKAPQDTAAMVVASEDGTEQTWHKAELAQQVSSLQQFLSQRGITKGDRVAAFVTCSGEASMAFLASCSIGAVWSACSPDFGVDAVIDRFAQIEPRVLFAVDGYLYNGKFHDRRAVVEQLIKALPSLEVIVIIPRRETTLSHSDTRVVSWQAALKAEPKPLTFERVPFNHPLWILYSSGTTGLPKAITQGHGGILLEQLKYGAFHNDYHRGERCFWYTTTGWMMWNYLHGSMLAGGTMVLYDGSPAHPDLRRLWQLAQDLRIAHFGTSAGFIMANRKAGLRPGSDFDLGALRSIGSTGSTLPPEGFEWVYREVKADLWLASMSGGTDICSAFVGGNPTMPVYSGEIQCRALGCDLHAFDDDGKPVTGGVGEMVITAPMPSMPIYFWDDPGYRRYTESYFEMYPGVWRHGDWIELTERDGVIIYGRSDATLNRGGVRIGTSEVYRAMEKVPEVKDSLIVCVEQPGGNFWMPLFVVLQEGHTLSEDLNRRIRATLRNEYSPRHVPDEIIPVDAIPYTISGKKTESPVKKILMGNDAEKVLKAGSLRNPESLNFFLSLARERR